MKRSVNWVAASIFFLAGSLLYAIPALARSILYAGTLSGPIWQVPNQTVEQLVPDFLNNLAFVAYLICTVIVAWPPVAQWFESWWSTPVQTTPGDKPEA